MADRNVRHSWALIPAGYRTLFVMFLLATFLFLEVLYDLLYDYFEGGRGLTLRDSLMLFASLAMIVWFVVLHERSITSKRPPAEESAL